MCVLGGWGGRCVDCAVRAQDIRAGGYLGDQFFWCAFVFTVFCLAWLSVICGLGIGIDQMGVELGKVLAKNILGQLGRPEDVRGHDSSVGFLVFFLGWVWVGADGFWVGWW